ncbi:MAG: response regulator [Lachnospiraceae bacterium]|nr:response regulator [Lachnospiraceae bacterium]
MFDITKPFGKSNILKSLSFCTAAAVLATAFLYPLKIAASDVTSSFTFSDTGQSLNGGGYSASGQIEGAGYSASVYDSSNGLPTSDANYILCSSDGYVWIGSYSGIIRYDGSNFVRMDTSGGLTSGRGLFEDSLHRIWVATNDNGVVLLEGEESTHFTYKDGLPSSSVRCFEEDGKGNIIIGTTSGLAYVDPDKNLVLIDDERLENETVIRLSTDLEGTVFGVTKSGHIFSVRDLKVTNVFDCSDLGIDKISMIYSDPLRSGYVYIGTSEGVLYHGRFGDTKINLRKIFCSPLTNIQWISYDCGKLWVSSQTMSGYLDDDFAFHVLYDLPVDSAIEMMTSDYQGNLWYASSTLGVMNVVTNNFVNITKNAGIDCEVVNATCLYRDMLYIGTGNGLYVLNSSGEPVNNAITDYLAGCRIRCITADSKGNLWFAVYNHDMGVVCLKSSGRIINITVQDGLPSNEIRCVVESSTGSILVGSNGGFAEISDFKVVRVVGESEVVKNPVFLTVAEGNYGLIYVGTDGDGIYQIAQDHVEKLGRDDGLTSDVVMRIRHDEARDLYWIITSNSIQYIRDGRIKTVSSFPYNNNYDIYFDDKDNAWILSSYGVYCVRIDDMLSDSITEFDLYTNANGLTSTPTSNSYSALDDNGNLYISGRDGVSCVNINNYFRGDVDVKVALDYILCDDERILPDENGRYTIPASDGRIVISTSVMDYSMTNPLVHVYLEGSDDNGITAYRNNLSSLEYTRLRYGKYILHIQILDSRTGQVRMDRTYEVVKKPRLTELLFTQLLVIFVLIIISAFVVWRIVKITFIKRQYDEIRKAKEDAERANSAKSRFLANMSHEIRTPINTIMGMDEMILREDAEGVPKNYFLSIINYALDIRNASESLLGLINDLLDMSKIESGKMHLVEQDYDVQNLLSSIVSMIRVRSLEKDLNFDVSVDEIIPKKLFGDSGKIKQIVLNLLTNAVKYTESGGFSLNVSLESRTDDRIRLVFSVKDTGIGIRKEDMDKLFSAYERFDEEKNFEVQGTGLGLDISRRFAELLGGELTCKSEYGVGSEFTLVISQKIIDDTPIGIFNEHADSEAKGPYVPKFVAPDADVLVVDDNPMNLNVIKGLLKSTKVFVTTAESGEECIEKIKNNTYNVVLLDHMMPGMDGVETLEKIRSFAPDLPVYALTANAAAGEEFYTSRGFNGYLSKPIDSATLERTIMQHIPEHMMLKNDDNEGFVELSEIPDNMQWIYETEGINVVEGIKNSGGITSYIFSLNLFYDTIDDNARVIKDSLEADNLRLYTIKVHALKTSLRIIGAMELSAMAEKLESAGNSGDMDFINENHPGFFEEYLKFKDKFKSLRESKDDTEKEMIPDSELKGAFDALRDVIPQMDYDSVEMILDGLGDYKLPEEVQDKVEKLRTYLKTFDWEKMEELV